MSFERITEQPSNYRHLDKMPVAELLVNINNEDKTVPYAIEKAIPQIEKLVEAASDKMLSGGRLFYVGAGTSGRLGVVDASECPPTYGVPYGLVNAIIAGGEKAITMAVEYAEDNKEEGWNDLVKNNISDKDFVIGIAASGTTPYVLGALEGCRARGILTGSITNNPGSPLARVADYPVEIEVGPEFVTGSTRMKAGTAQKLILNMISTATMIRLGHIEDNKMVDMQLTNNKLIERGIRMIMEKTNCNEEEASALLKQHGSVRKSIQAFAK